LKAGLNFLGLVCNEVNGTTTGVTENESITLLYMKMSVYANQPIINEIYSIYYKSDLDGMVVSGQRVQRSCFRLLDQGHRVDSCPLGCL
jgi:hypothetical protein